MTRRKRSKISASASGEISKREFLRFDDLPRDWFAEIATTYEKLVVRVRRRNPLGQVQTLYTVPMPVESLGVLDGWCEDMAGGGNYNVEFIDPDDVSKILATCTFRVEGRIRVARPLAKPGSDTDVDVVTVPPALAQFAGFDPDDLDLEDEDGLGLGDAELDDWNDGPFDSPLNPTQLPHAIVTTPEEGPMTHPTTPTTPAATPPGGTGAWFGGLPAAEQPKRPRQAMGLSTLASDQLERERAERELAARMRAEAEVLSLRERSAERERQLERELADMKAQLMRSAHEAEMRALNDKIASLAAAVQAGPSKPVTNSASEIAAMIAPFVPVLIALITSSKDSATAQMQMQQSLLTTLATKEPSAAPDPLAAGREIMTMLAPFIQRAMAPREPAGPSLDMVRAMGEQQMQMAGMTANLLGVLAESQAPEVAKPFLQQLIDNGPAIFATLGAFADQMKKLEPRTPPAPQRLQVPVPHQPVHRAAPPTTHATPAAPAGPVTSATMYETADDGLPVEVVDVASPSAADSAPTFASTESDGTAEPVTVDLSTFSAVLPPALTAPAWRQWMKALHRGEPASEVGGMLAALLAALGEGALPDDVQSAINADVRGFLVRMGMMTPMGQSNPLYIQQVVHQAVLVLASMGAGDDGDEDDDLDDEQAPEEAPAATPFPQ